MFQKMLQGGGGDTPKGVIDEKYLLFSDGEIFNDALKLCDVTIQDKKIIVDGNNTYTNTKGVYVNTQTLPLVIIFESSRGGTVQTGTGNANAILPDIALSGANRTNFTDIAIGVNEYCTVLTGDVVKYMCCFSARLEIKQIYMLPTLI